MARLRLGVALLVPPPHDATVDTLRRAVGDPALERIPAHLTLVPPVNVREEELPVVLDVLRSAAAGSSPLRLVLGPPATFLPDNPVLYLGVAGDLDGVHALRDAVFTGPLRRPLTWPFVPHVTLADEAPPERVEAAVAALAPFALAVRIEAVHLLREAPGRIWEPIADAALGAPATVGTGGLELVLTRSHHTEGSIPFAFTARREGRVVGSVSGLMRSGRAEVFELLVADGERGQGVGTQLVSAVESLAAGEGCGTVTAWAETGSRLRAFYEGRGWTTRAGAGPGPSAGAGNVELVRVLT